VFAGLQLARAAAMRLRELLPQQPHWTAPIETPTLERATPTTATHAHARIESAGLVVGFPGGARIQVADVALAGPALVAVAGPSGAGKTTWLRTALGLIPPLDGRLRVAGVDINSDGVVDEAALRSRVAMVPQGAALLAATWRDNLSLGRPLDDAAIRHALHQVGLAGALDARGTGLDANLAEEGAGLSGGQAQRLAIARALLGEPAVLLLDEPTASLDESNERALVALLRDIARGRLVVMITHRKEVVDAADVVLWVEAGRMQVGKPEAGTQN
jgi:ABC-type transport system involved in cytochrome bd biosynthesis fused ATPase/permease subunit